MKYLIKPVENTNKVGVYKIDEFNQIMDCIMLIEYEKIDQIRHWIEFLAKEVDGILYDQGHDKWILVTPYDLNEVN